MRNASVVSLILCEYFRFWLVAESTTSSTFIETMFWASSNSAVNGKKSPSSSSSSKSKVYVASESSEFRVSLVQTIWFSADFSYVQELFSASKLRGGLLPT